MSVVDICNSALSMVGARATISSLTEESASAKACRVHYDITRSETQMAIAWPFTRRYITLSLLGAKAGTPENLDGSAPVPEGDWVYCYAYPSDCVKPIWIKPSSTGEIETPFVNLGNVRDAQNNYIYFAEGTRFDDTSGNLQRVLYTNKSGATLMYVADIVDPSLFPSDYKEVLIKTLASKIIIGLNGDKNLLQGLLTESKQLLGRALQVHGQEHEKDKRPVILDPMPSMMNARTSSYFSTQYPYGSSLYPYTS